MLCGGPRGREGKVAEIQCSIIRSSHRCESGVGLSPALATCETSQVLLVGVSGGFPMYSRFAPPTDWVVWI